MLRGSPKLKKQEALLKLTLNDNFVLKNFYCSASLWLIKNFVICEKLSVINFWKFSRIFEKQFDPKACLSPFFQL